MGLFAAYNCFNKTLYTRYCDHCMCSKDVHTPIHTMGWFEMFLLPLLHLMNSLISEIIIYLYLKIMMAAY